MIAGGAHGTVVGVIYEDKRFRGLMISFIISIRHPSSISIQPTRPSSFNTFVFTITIMKSALAGAALLIAGVLATPAPLSHLSVRAPDTTNNLPAGDKNCNGNLYTPSDIRTAVEFAWEAKKDGRQYSKF